MGHCAFLAYSARLATHAIRRVGQRANALCGYDVRVDFIRGRPFSRSPRPPAIEAHRVQLGTATPPLQLHSPDGASSTLPVRHERLVMASIGERVRILEVKTRWKVRTVVEDLSA